MKFVTWLKIWMFLPGAGDENLTLHCLAHTRVKSEVTSSDVS